MDMQDELDGPVDEIGIEVLKDACVVSCLGCRNLWSKLRKTSKKKLLKLMKLNLAFSLK